MKPPLFTLTLLALVALCAAWTKEDHEIFRVRDDLIAAEGDNVTFYSFIGVSPSASADAIIKQVRQRSRQLHPDKAIPLLISRRSQGVKESGANKKAPTSKERRQISQEATQRYQRFTVIRDILQGPSRERYDHFLRNGFPLWRGSGYYYDRLRPGLGSVLVGLLLVFGGGAHYAAMYVGWKRHRDFVERYIANAQRMAWGEAGIPGIPNLTPGSEGTFATTNTATEVDPTASDPVMALNRKQKRMQEKENKKKDTGKAAKSAKTSGISKPVASEPMTGPQGSKKKVVAENGKVLIVDAIGNVFLETQTEEGEKHQLLLDPEEIPPPTIFQTALFRVPVWFFSQTIGRITNKAGVDPEDPLLEDGDLMMNNPRDHADEVIENATAINANAEMKKRGKRNGRV